MGSKSWSIRFPSQLLNRHVVNQKRQPVSGGQEDEDGLEPLQRVPESCPEGFQRRYTVRTGDTMFLIAQRFGVGLNALIAANPQIPNPDVIFPGDVLCVPGVPPTPSPTPTPPPEEILTPCCVVMDRTSAVSGDASGVALVRKLQVLRPGRRAITVAAHGLPRPSQFGDFNAYEAIAFIPGEITWRWALHRTPETTATFVTWAGTFTEITAALPANTRIQVRPVNTSTQQAGSAVLSDTLANCQA